ncbi:MAG TPA: cytochrome P450 [Ideonella sp.]|uniref:cytochrome P450 n=1 Tax=Ideonella sp. TaxID=1929293 RepID=UPI002E3184F9|nr:cytochrome P450 [Ideonella sp.]HEX5682998.1 cytochrome P450 [Ideonella sp.]
MTPTPTTTPAAATAAPPAPRRIADLPGPRGLPLLGNTLQLDRDRLHQQAEAWARQYGEAYRMRIGRRRFLVLSNPEVVAAVLRDRPEGFKRTERLSQTAREFGFHGLFSANGEAWRRQRPMVLAGLDPTHIKSFFPTLVKVTQRFAQRWQRAAQRGEPIDLQADLMRYTVDVTAGLAFGADINTIESDDEVIQQHLDKVLPALFKRVMAPVRYWGWFKLPADRRLDQHLAALADAVQGFIAAAQARLMADPALRANPRNLIEAMLAARDRDGSTVTDEDVSGNVLTMLLAGEDTTANTLAWMIWQLHHHPDATARAAAEARAVVGPASLVTQPEQLQRLDYVEACAHETMRLRPVAPLIIQQAARDTVVAGIEVPVNSLVMCLMRPAAVSDTHFVDAERFMPERWLAHGPAGQAASSAKRVSMPFGAGPRICPGRYLALAEMKMVISMLLASFRIESVDTVDGAPVRERLALTMSPIGLRMRLRTASALSV